IPMDLKTTLQSDLKDAMRHGEETRKSTLRMVLTAIKLAEVEKTDHVMDEAAYLAVIQKEIKARREAIADAEKANRPEMIKQSEEEIKILQAYLPAAFSDAELEELAKAAIEEAGATSIREMGQVMKILVPRLQGRATGEQASQVVRRLLQ
ncbi:MAG: GatB/YqeY domain-containing protein, partial [Acidobacteriaceae bacterium]